MTASTFIDLTNGTVQADLLLEIGEEVAHVEAELSRQMSSRVEMVSTVGAHTLDAGGKRLRPAFVTLSARATGLDFTPERARKLGACMEMIHMATLIHDDVIDNAPTRRGKDTASAIYGNTASILSGDVLLAKAMMLLAMDGDLSIIRTVSESVVDMAEGEVRELETRGDFDLEERDHLVTLEMKTASFIQCCCEVGAILAGASLAARQALRSYGYHVGMAFQIVDDLLDYRGDKSKTGKPLATDFREAQATLPLIHLRPLLSESEAQVARTKFGNGITDDEIRMICNWMDTRGAFSKAEAAARAHVDQALECLEHLPDTPTRNLLRAVAEYVVLRQK